MNCIPTYQFPFVDVFKLCKVFDSIEKQGVVSESFDKIINKKVLKLSGPSNTAAIFEIPKPGGQIKSLGLIGKIIYIECFSSPGKQFSIHLDYIVDSKLSSTITMSSLCKEPKKENNKNLKFPLQLKEKWTIVSISISKLLSDFGIFLPDSKNEFYLKSINIRGFITVKGIYTSDNNYDVRTLPKEMAFKTPKEVDWYNAFSWIDIPSLNPSDDINININFNKENSQLKKEEKKVTKNLKLKKKEQKDPTKKKLNADMNIPQPENLIPIPIQINNRDNNVKTIKDKNENENENIEETKNGYQNYNNDNDLIKNTLGEIELQLKTKEENKEEAVLIEKNAEIMRKILSPSPIKKEYELEEGLNFNLKPDPLISLNRIIPSIGVYSSSINFGKNSKFADEIFFSSQNLIIQQNITTGIQKFFFGHSSPIMNIFFLSHFLLSTSITNELIIWNMDTRSIHFSFALPLKSVIKIRETINSKLLIIAGKDTSKRDVILIVDAEKLFDNKEILIIFRQLSDFDIVNLNVSPCDNELFVTCGNENLRIMKFCKGVLKGKSAQLSGKNIKKRFMDCNFKVVDKHVSHILAVTECGLLFKLSCKLNQLEHIIKLHSDAIHSINTDFSHSVFVTSGADKYIKMWNEDFTNCNFSCQTESEIKSASLSIYGEKLAFIMGNSSIGILSINEKKLDIITRGSKEKIIDADYNSTMNALITASTDSIIRIWNGPSQSQIGQFVITNDIITCILSHPLLPIFSCGFKSGTLRMFDISKSTLLFEYNISDNLFASMSYTNDGQILATEDIEGNIVLFNTTINQPIKSLNIEYINPNYIDLKYSLESDLLCVTGPHSNRIQMWETTNYTIKETLDLSGDIVYKFNFASQDQYLIVLTASSQLRYFRRTKTSWNPLKIIPGIHDSQCLNFTITKNSIYLFTCGKDLLIKAFYFNIEMQQKGLIGQSFLGHSSQIKKIFLSPDNKTLFSIGDESNLYIWEIFADPSDIQKIGEEDNTKLLPIIDEFQEEKALSPPKPYSQAKIIIPERIDEFDDKSGKAMQIFEKASFGKIPEFCREYLLGINDKEINTIIWIKEEKLLAWGCNNKLIVQKLDQQSKQYYHLSSTDIINGLAISHNLKYLSVYNKESIYASRPTIYSFELPTFHLISEIVPTQSHIVSVEFSLNNNMLLVVTSESNSSIISIWDFQKGEMFAKAGYNFAAVAAKWNPCNSNLEFVVAGISSYTFWRLTPQLSLEYIEGTPAKDMDSKSRITSIGFSFPHKNIETILLIIGLSDGKLWFIDTRTNSFISVIQFCDVNITSIYTGYHRINILTESHIVSSIELNPDITTNTSEVISSFINSKNTMTLDSRGVGASFDIIGEEGFLLSELGTIWFINWTESACIRVFNHTDACGTVLLCQFKSYQLMELGNLSLLCTFTSDEYLKIWNTDSREQILKVKVAGEKCISMIFHPFKPILLCSYSDGYLRFLDVQSASNLGRCKLYDNDYINDAKFLPNGIHALTLSVSGIVDLITIDKWNPLSIKVAAILNTRITGIQIIISSLEPYNKFLITTTVGKVSVYNKRQFNSITTEQWQVNELPKFNLMDQFNIEEFINKEKNKNFNFKLKSESSWSNSTIASFLTNDSSKYICGMKDSLVIFIRSIINHQVLKQYQLSCKPLMMSFCPSRPLISICLSNANVYIHDLENDDNCFELETEHYGEISICQFVSIKKMITVGKGEVMEWSIK